MQISATAAGDAARGQREDDGFEGGRELPALDPAVFAAVLGRRGIGGILSGERGEVRSGTQLLHDGSSLGIALGQHDLAKADAFGDAVTIEILLVESAQIGIGGHAGLRELAAIGEEDGETARFRRLEGGAVRLEPGRDFGSGRLRGGTELVRRQLHPLQAKALVAAAIGGLDFLGGTMTPASTSSRRRLARRESRISASNCGMVSFCWARSCA